MNRQGGSSKSIYDGCATIQKNKDIVSPFQYRTYMGMYENCAKCKYDKFWKPFDAEIVDVESELKNITRPGSRCVGLKYDPRCKKSGMCMSTFDNSRPIIFDKDICPVVHNNIPRQTLTGLSPIADLECGKF